MNVTLILQQSIGSALRKLSKSFAPHHPLQQTHVRQTNARPSGARPLRVLRFVEGGMPRASVGRMVISGSMADVCAELDRLAAQELTLH